MRERGKSLRSDMEKNLKEKVMWKKILKTGDVGEKKGNKFKK